MICSECGGTPHAYERLVKGVCRNCYRRALRAAGRLNDDNVRVGRRAEQKRRWDRERAKRLKAERETSASSTKDGR